MSEFLYESLFVNMFEQLLKHGQETKHHLEKAYNLYNKYNSMVNYEAHMSYHLIEAENHVHQLTDLLIEIMEWMSLTEKN